MLNVFSDAPGVLTETSVERASVLAAFATVATHAAAHGQDAATLRRGLDSNREIGKAIGMLMVRDDISDTDAFDVTHPRGGVHDREEHREEHHDRDQVPQLCAEDDDQQRKQR
ncbi:ANTAR domain-containing protein, partial [Mycolicibacterium vaccae]|nr:ANTAR domain-containing protein [Mycolicibacterium vaccae]